MLGPILKRIWFFYPWLIFLALGLSVLAVAEPFLYGKIIDTLIGSLQDKSAAQETFWAIFPFLGLWLVFVFAETLLAGTFTFATWVVGNRLANTFLVELYRRILRLDVKKFHEMKGGEILRRFNNAWDATWQLNLYLIKDYLSAFMRLSMALGVGLWIDWRLTLVTLTPVPIIMFLGIFNLKRTEPAQHEVNKLYDEVSGHVGDAFDNITSMKAFRGEETSISLVDKEMKGAHRLQSLVNRKWALGETIIGPTYLLGRLAIFASGAWFVLNGTSTLGTLIMFLGFVSFIYGSIQQVSFSLPEMARALVRIMRATEFWEEIPMVKDRPGAKAAKNVKGLIEFAQVEYGYHDGNSVLQGVSFTIPAGQTLALVGESGAGKSTLAQMLLRFFDPKSGSILIDGLDIRDIKLDSLRANIGFVMQENLLFHDTILNNIRFAKPSASEKDIIAAAKRAQAHEFIKGLKNGYKTVVGERGVKLSGGEKQRVALARVLLADPPILVLDEATSALDSKTEHALQMALHEVMKNRTTLVIAHRLSTVMNADNILVMHKGRIVDHGKHADLIQRGGLYKQYWEIQAGGYV
jgi:glucan exporter ATP-binding protein